MIVRTGDLSFAPRAGLGSDLRAYHDHLMAPLAARPAVALDAALLRCVVASPASELRRRVDLMVDYAYSARYQDSLVHLADPWDGTGPAMVLAVIQPYDGGEFVVGTCRLAWDRLEVLDLFTVPPPERWPHELVGQPFGEIGRLALHPVVDALVRAPEPAVGAEGRAYRAAVWQCMRERCDRLFRERGRPFTYHIASPRVRRFLVSTTYPAVQVTQAQPATSPLAGWYRSRWWRYFQPDAGPDHQPRVYVSPVPGVGPAGDP